jgi:hypothetical protein
MGGSARRNECTPALWRALLGVEKTSSKSSSSKRKRASWSFMCGRRGRRRAAADICGARAGWCDRGERWLAWASRSRLDTFVVLGRKGRFGFHGPEPHIALAMLNLGGYRPALPSRT